MIVYIYIKMTDEKKLSKTAQRCRDDPVYREKQRILSAAYYKNNRAAVRQKVNEKRRMQAKIAKLLKTRDVTRVSDDTGINYA
jgi:hypothetical protein